MSELKRNGITIQNQPGESLAEKFQKHQDEAFKHEFRESVIDLQNHMLAVPGAQTEFNVEHHFSYGVYGRVFRLEAGKIVIGKIHRHETLNVLISGECRVLSEDGIVEHKAGDIWVSNPGAKRVVYCRTDIVWLTSHANPSNTQDLEQLEAEIIAPDYEHVSLPMDELKELIGDQS